MASIKKEMIIKASPDAVWKVAGDFAGIAEWHPAIESLEMVEGEEEPRRLLTRQAAMVVGGVDDPDLWHSRSRRR